MNECIDRDYVLIECSGEKLKLFVQELECDYPVKIIKKPHIALTMIRACDTIEEQEFYAGEVLMSECEVSVHDSIGYGICIGEEPLRAYCIAVIDAIIRYEQHIPSSIENFLKYNNTVIRENEAIEFHHSMKTKVNFKQFDEK